MFNNRDWIKVWSRQLRVLKLVWFCFLCTQFNISRSQDVLCYFIKNVSNSFEEELRNFSQSQTRTPNIGQYMDFHYGLEGLVELQMTCMSSNFVRKPWYPVWTVSRPNLSHLLRTFEIVQQSVFEGIQERETWKVWQDGRISVFNHVCPKSEGEWELEQTTEVVDTLQIVSKQAK